MSHDAIRVTCHLIPAVTSYLSAVFASYTITALLDHQRWMKVSDRSMWRRQGRAWRPYPCPSLVRAPVVVLSPPARTGLPSRRALLSRQREARSRLPAW